MHRKVGSDVRLKVDEIMRLAKNRGSQQGHDSCKHHCGALQQECEPACPAASGYTACNGLHAESIPDVGPEHLLILRGCADCPSLEIMVQHGGGCNYLRSP